MIDGYPEDSDFEGITSFEGTAQAFAEMVGKLVRGTSEGNFWADNVRDYGEWDERVIYYSFSTGQCMAAESLLGCLSQSAFHRAFWWSIERNGIYTYVVPKSQLTATGEWGFQLGA